MASDLAIACDPVHLAATVSRRSKMKRGASSGISTRATREGAAGASHDATPPKGDDNDLV